MLVSPDMQAVVGLGQAEAVVEVDRKGRGFRPCASPL